MATLQPHEERRRFSRVSFERPAMFTVGAETCRVEVADVSLQGALLVVPPAFAAAAGSRCTLVIQLDGAEAVIRLEGEVVHRAGTRVGMGGTSIDLESVAHLRRMVELNLGDEELLHRELAALIGCADP
jgi:hypothetical protein